VISAKNEIFQSHDYTSSRIITKDKKFFKYGRVDIRAVLPEGQGIWPALWMLGSNIGTAGWPACGEIDIMEMIGGSGREKTVYGTAHWDNGGHDSSGKSYSLGTGTYADKFHVFSIVWNETSITWYMDDIQYNTVDTTPATRNEFQNNFFFIFNLAVGGDWPGNPNSATGFPQHLIVDYIRMFQ
jgi:beta-glucanase (GH16 family)